MTQTHKCYGLTARGHSLNGWVFKVCSRNLFLSLEDAENHKAEFERRCCDPSEFECAERDTLEIHVVEYTLNGWDEP